MSDWPELQNQINIAANKVRRILDEMRWENLTEAETAARLWLAETIIHDWIDQIYAQRGLEAESRSVTSSGSPESAANTDGEGD